MKEGVFELEITNANPYNQYFVVKKYGNKFKSKAMPTLIDCMEQIKEWDEDYTRKTKDAKFKHGLLQLKRKLGIEQNKYNEKHHHCKPNYIYARDINTNEIVLEGTTKEIAEYLGTTAKHLNDISNKKVVCRKQFYIEKAK